MKVFMIGGTGLLGSEAAFELVKRNHEVATVSLPPLPEGLELPAEMEIEFGDFIKMSDDEIEKKMVGCEGFIFAAGIDERVAGPPPVYDMFRKFNIDALERMLRIAKKTGVKHTVVCGSYFCHFAELLPEERLAEWHPYIRSRIDQEKLCLSFADDSFDVAVLQIPYVFGTQAGRKPVWLFLVEQLRKMRYATIYPKGGTAMLTARQAGQSIAGALERNRGGKRYPLGYFNMTWKEMLCIFHRHMGIPGRKIITIPDWLYALGGRLTIRKQKKEGVEGGLHPVKFTRLMCSKTYIDRQLGCDILGVECDDIEAAIGESVELCMDILDGKTEALDMKTG